METVMVMEENQTFKEIIDNALSALKSGCRALILDFSRIYYLPSSTLGVIVALDKKFRDDGAVIKLRNLNDDAVKQLKLFGLDKLIIGETNAHS